MPILDLARAFPMAGKPNEWPEFFSRQVREARRFYFDLAPPPETPLAVVCGGCEHCEPEYAIHRAGFPYYSIEFVARGKGTLTLAGTEYPLAAGLVFSYGPGVPQDIATSPRDPLVKYFVDFAGARAKRLVEQYGPGLGKAARVGVPGEIQDAFDGLIENGLRATGFSPLLCASLLEYLAVKIAESLLPWEAGETPAYATYQRCRRHIQGHFLRLRTLEQIAAACHVHPAYLCRLFRRYAHQSPYQFLLWLKMNHAAQRFQDPGVTVKKVAAELGFDDSGHFSRAFKSVFGVSPAAFRRLR